MAEGPCLIGIDVRTGGVRVGLFDRDGSPGWILLRRVPDHPPAAGWAEGMR
jgi:hypothetical protein